MGNKWKNTEVQNTKVSFDNFHRISLLHSLFKLLEQLSWYTYKINSLIYKLYKVLLYEF